MCDFLDVINKELVIPNRLHITDIVNDKHSVKYSGCSFKIENKKIIYRLANVTPKKIGQFVALWKKSLSNSIKNIPYSFQDADFYMIYTVDKFASGVFIFPKHILASNGILAMDVNSTDGKLGFRLYPKWDIPKRVVAAKTQMWQLEWFIDLSQLENIDKNKFNLIINQE